MSTASIEIEVESHYTLVAAPKPRPSDKAIHDMMAAYYDALSQDFDEVNSEQSFGLYLNAINLLVAARLNQIDPLATVLSVGSGTGAREVSIRNTSKREFDFVCIDASKKMCALAAARGLKTAHASFLEFDVEPQSFDAAIFLNAFEVLASEEERLACLRKISRQLRTGGILFIDAMDIENKKDAWAERVKDQYQKDNLSDWGYTLGDCFCRRSDQNLTVFAHYSSLNEMERLLTLSGFSILERLYLAEDSGAECQAGEGHLFFIAEACGSQRSSTELAVLAELAGLAESKKETNEGVQR